MKQNSLFKWILNVHIWKCSDKYVKENNLKGYAWIIIKINVTLKQTANSVSINKNHSNIVKDFRANKNISSIVTNFLHIDK